MLQCFGISEEGIRQMYADEGFDEAAPAKTIQTPDGVTVIVCEPAAKDWAKDLQETPIAPPGTYDRYIEAACAAAGILFPDAPVIEGHRTLPAKWCIGVAKRWNPKLAVELQNIVDEKRRNLPPKR